MFRLIDENTLAGPKGRGNFPMNRVVPGKPQGRQKGFSLLEILVAFSILAITLGILMQIFSKGIHLASTGDRYSRALLMAESILATVGQTGEIEVGETWGETEDSYEWSIDVQPYEDEELEPGIVKPQFSLYRVQVSVRWENRGVFLETLRFGPGI